METLDSVTLSAGGSSALISKHGGHLIKWTLQEGGGELQASCSASFQPRMQVLEYDGSGHPDFPHPFEVRTTVTLDDKTPMLTQDLSVKNTGVNM